MHSRIGLTHAFCAAVCVGLMSAPAVAQPAGTGSFPKLALELRGGVATPAVAATSGRGTWDPDATGSFGFNFGARPARFLQLDMGLDFSLGAFGASGQINTTRGMRNISDRELLVTMGPRLVVPLTRDDTGLVSFGGGYAYAHYSEFAQGQANETVVGFSGGSRSGHGAYMFLQTEFAPSRTSPVTLGVRVGFVQATTNGTSVGQFPGGIETTDRWPTVVGTVSFRGLR